MIFGTGATLLDTIVLAIISNYGETGSYGYQITQDTLKLFDISESTLYPVLRRLKAEDLLKTYDKAIDGRNRRYYVITGEGLTRLRKYAEDWKTCSAQINTLLSEVRYE